MAVRLGSLAVAAVLIVSGCGGATGGETVANRPLTKAEFVRQANAGCVKGRAGLRRKVAEYLEIHRDDGKPRPVLNAGLAHFVLLPAIEAEVVPMFHLATPPGEKSRIGTLLKVERYAIDELANSDRIDSRAAFERRFAEPERMFRAYGLAGCAPATRWPLTTRSARP